MSNYTGTDNLEMMAAAVHYNQYLLSLVRSQAQANDRILDFGAGIGAFAEALAYDGYRVHCIEPDAKQAAIIAAAGLSVSETLEGLANGSIDYLYSLNVLEHIEDDVATLRQWYQKLKPGGRILVYVPAFQMLYSSMDSKVGHFRRYTRRELTDKVSVAGFAVMVARYVDCAGFLASLLYKVAGNDSGDINRRALVAYDRFVFPLSCVGDSVFSRLFGKNIFLTATRKAM